jgi:hypothetical protein
VRIIQTKDERNISAVTQQPAPEIIDWNSSILRWKVAMLLMLARQLYTLYRNDQQQIWQASP